MEKKDWSLFFRGGKKKKSKKSALPRWYKKKQKNSEAKAERSKGRAAAATVQSVISVPVPPAAVFSVSRLRPATASVCVCMHGCSVESVNPLDPVVALLSASL